MTITGVELWDAPVAGKMLQEWRDDVLFPDRVAEVVAARFAGVDRVHVAGGGATDAIRDALAARGFACTLSSDPFDAARVGAASAGACADVGQSSIKLVASFVERRVARDITLMPFRDDVPLEDRDGARARTMGSLARILRTLPATHVLVGLPCEIVDGVPRGCSYCWRDPDPELVGFLTRLSRRTIAIVNDAVLAAMAVPARTGTTAVVTVGFGVGGALITT
jgi:hypothetical protein